MHCANEDGTFAFSSKKKIFVVFSKFVRVQFKVCLFRFFVVLQVMVSELMTHGSVDDLIHAPNAAETVSLRQRIKIGLNFRKSYLVLACPA